MLHQRNTQYLSLALGNCMGKTLLPLSCGAASITGLVIAAGKPIRLARPWALPPALSEGSGPHRSERSREGGANCGEANRCGGGARKLSCAHKANQGRPFCGKALRQRLVGGRASGTS